METNNVCGGKVEVKVESSEKGGIVKQKTGENFQQNAFSSIHLMQARNLPILAGPGPDIFPVFKLNDQSCNPQLPSTNNQFL